MLSAIAKVTEQVKGQEEFCFLSSMAFLCPWLLLPWCQESFRVIAAGKISKFLGLGAPGQIELGGCWKMSFLALVSLEVKCNISNTEQLCP